MLRSFKFRAVFAVIMITALMLSLTGCSASGGSSGSSASGGTPALPSGFADLTVPDIVLGGYAYVNQSAPIVITPDFLLASMEKISVDSLQVWGGPDADSYGGLVDFQNQADATRVLKLAGQVTLPVWTASNGKVVYCGNKASTSWNTALKNAVTGGQMVSASTKYPDVSNDFTFFPSNPPLRPFAAGYLDVNSTLAESVAGKLGISISSYISGLKSAGVSRLCFVGYTAQNVAVSTKSLTVDYLNSLQLGALAVGRSSYPDIAINVAFDKAMTDAGLTRYNTNNVDIYSYADSGIYVLVAHKGSTIYAAVAQTKDRAQNLLLSCF